MTPTQYAVVYGQVVGTYVFTVVYIMQGEIELCIWQYHIRLYSVRIIIIEVGIANSGGLPR